ncbi:unnamed protein product [Polarella glacialis]|uniref:Cyclic nucleotide-binding domain-containing protein n=1 Tax=Polarella glacialis TaxID=89957 RepID=A0A813IV74_POLGL|nr:unnamed protein product [Polarella glacialis]
MFEGLLAQALVEIAHGHEEELCRVTEALRTENASLASQLARLQMQLSSASQLPPAEAPPKPPLPLEMPDLPKPPPPLEMPDLALRQGTVCPGRGGAEMELHENQAVDLPNTVEHGDEGAFEAVPNSSIERNGKEDTANAFVLPLSAGAQSQEPPEILMERHGVASTSSSNEAEQSQECPTEQDLPVDLSTATSVVGSTPATMEDDHNSVQLHLVWKQACVEANLKSSSMRVTVGSHTLQKRLFSQVSLAPYDAERSCCWSRLDSLVMNPGSSKRVAFEVFGLLLIFYDLVWYPAQVFGFTSVPFTRAILWLSSAFWACDLLVSFFVGLTIHDHGLIEMRVSKIARHYATTWLPIDLLLVLLDWTLNALLLLSDHEVADFGGGAFLEKVQFLRLLRLLRLFKATNIISVLSDRIQSETMRILVRVLALLVFIMLINHLIACCWYAVGINYIEQQDTWVKANDLKGKGDLYAYTTALHWSITQFTPASMEVVPVNELERSFTIFVIVSAMVIFSSFISTITNAMTQLRNLNSERNAELVKLRRFFSEHKVSASLVTRISSCIHQSTKLTSSRVHSEDVSILELLPVSLKCDLAEEVFAPTFCAHPFMLTWGEYYPRESKRLFLAARSSSLGARHELFNTGQVAESMYFLSSGAMVFIRDDRELADIPAFVSPGQWLAEPALWIKWKHVGHASSTETNCELVSLHCETAIRILSQNTSTISGARRYAKTFAAYFDKQSDQLSDVWADMDVLEAMVSSAFIKHEKELLRQEFGSTVSPKLTRKTSMTLVRMISRKLTSSHLEEMRADEENMTALHERVSKYSADGQMRREILGIRSSDSDSDSDSSHDVMVPISDSICRPLPPASRNPQGLSRSTSKGIASAFRILTRQNS